MMQSEESFTERLDTQRRQLEEDFSHSITIDDFDAQPAALGRYWSRPNRAQLLRELHEMLDDCGIQYQTGQELSYYRGIAAAADIPTLGTVEQRMTYTLIRRLRQYPAPEQYLARITGALDEARPVSKPKPLRLSILRRFISHADWLRGAGYGGRLAIRHFVSDRAGHKVLEKDVPAMLDDDVFSLLDAASREQQKSDGKYGLLKIANDLGVSRFRTQGGTRRSLYLLALAYDMRFYPDPATADPTRDIERNLFRGYYTNNLIRFLSRDCKERPGDFETDPDGHGINYKNFAEMIYLYYLARDGSPAEKIADAAQMIERVRSRVEHAPASSLPWRDTRDYEDILRNEDVFQRTEEEFEDFLLENYQCSTLVTDGGKHRLWRTAATASSSVKPHPRMNSLQRTQKVPQTLKSSWRGSRTPTWCLTTPEVGACESKPNRPA